VLVVLASEARTPPSWTGRQLTRASLSWIILAAAIFGWLLGIATAAVVHRRTRREDNDDDAGVPSGSAEALNRSGRHRGEVIRHPTREGNSS
jgi:hypothetical protein